MMQTSSYPLDLISTTRDRDSIEQIRPELKILGLFLYYSLLRSFLWFFGGPDAPGNVWLSRAITAVPFVLFGMWLFAYLDAHKTGRGSTARTQSAPGVLGFFLLEFCLVFFYAAFAGFQNNNPYFSMDTRGLVILFLTAGISFLSVHDIAEVRQLLKWFLPGLFVLALLRFLNYSAGWFGIRLAFYDVWTNGILVSLGYCLYFISYLLVDKRDRKDLLVLLTFAGGVLITFHKPVVWSVACATAAMMWMVWRVKSFGHGTKRSFGLVLLIGAFLFVVNYMAKANPIERYRTEFYIRYLKASPTTGQQLDTPVLGGRLYLWRDALDRFLESPFVGYGLGATATSTFWNLPEVAPHNIILSFLLTTGGIGLFVVSGLFISWLVPVWRSLRKNDEDLALKFGLFGFVIVVMAYSMVGTLWVVSSITYLFGMVLGVLLKIALIVQDDAHGPVRCVDGDKW